ncbi:MAG TPA: arylamine N-acetyltransferase [Rhodopila sp.]|uniref:arylamine N-acetyltransferase family protein n=1 Tax=Rhodopila sp. TaxID=2480087 RepID=UPI002C1183BB|nr:arylamine N-acetyltransferase [Rhodopila sp.]HVY14768.1 arylamine N-acetyltransferase [Rhodopila sp.]
MPIDLDAYFARIGYDGPVEPTPAVLRALVACHGEAIAFEAIDVIAERPVSLDIDAVADKLIRRRRGGYCFEQNMLLRAVLDAIGFRTDALLARVRRGSSRDAERPRTHMLLRVEMENGAWLADVGFGGLTPSAPLAMVPDQAQATPHETMRVTPFGSDLMLQVQLNGTWEDLYQIGHEPQSPVDFEAANWFTATHPASVFRNNVVATRPVPGGRLVLFNGIFTRRTTAGVADKQAVTSAADYRRVLVDAFGLAVTEEDVATILALRERQGPVTFDPFS